MELKERLKNELKGVNELDGVLGTIVAKTDGFLVVSYLPAGMDSRLLAALAAAISKSSSITSKEIGMGDFNSSVIKASGGYYVCFPVGSGIVLASLVEKNMNIGILLIRMKKCAKQIVRTLRHFEI